MTVPTIAPRALGITPADVTVHMGDSDLPPVLIAGGSNSAASMSLVVAKACEEIRIRLATAAIQGQGGPLKGLHVADLKLLDGMLTDQRGHAEPLQAAIERAGSRIEAYAEHVPDGLPPGTMTAMTKGKPAMLSGSSRKDVTAYAFGAHFVEVHVHSRTREIRVRRITSAFAA